MSRDRYIGASGVSFEVTNCTTKSGREEPPDLVSLNGCRETDDTETVGCFKGFFVIAMRPRSDLVFFVAKMMRHFTRSALAHGFTETR